jgi:hypothetical protein
MGSRSTLRERYRILPRTGNALGAKVIRIRRGAITLSLLLILTAFASQSSPAGRPTGDQSTPELLRAEVSSCEWTESTEALRLQLRLIPTRELLSLGILPDRIGLRTFGMVARYADGSQSQVSAGGPIQGSQADLRVEGMSQLPTTLMMTPVEFTVDTDTVLTAQSPQFLSGLSARTSLGSVAVDSVKAGESHVTLVLQFTPLSIAPSASMRGTGGVDLRFPNGAWLVEVAESASPVGAGLSVRASLTPSPLEASKNLRGGGRVRLSVASLSIDYETPISLPLTGCA